MASRSLGGLMIISRVREKHFTKKFNCGASSDRRVLPGGDDVRVKITHVFTVVDAEWKDISYPTDETVFVHRGEVELELSDGTKHILTAGDLYFVVAGEIYTLRDHHGFSELICVFSQAGSDGELVNNS